MAEFIEVLEEKSRQQYKRNAPPDKSQNSATRTGKVTDLALKGLRRTNARYTDDQQGFEAFKKRSLEFLEEIQAWNERQDESKNVICPSIELWATYLGTSRVSIKNYSEYSYPEYPEFIRTFKNAIQSAKFDFVSHGSMNPMVYVFDTMNNADGYQNTNQIGLVAVTNTPRINAPGIESKYLSIGEPEAPELPE